MSLLSTYPTRFYRLLEMSEVSAVINNINSKISLTNCNNEVKSVENPLPISWLFQSIDFILLLKYHKSRNTETYVKLLI